MKNKTLPQLEAELVQFLWSKGFVSFKGNSPKVNGINGNYVVAMNRENLSVLNVVQLESGNSKVGVGDEAKELSRMKTAMPMTLPGDRFSITTGFAIAKGWDENWYYENDQSYTLKYKDDHKTLMEVLQ